MGKDRLDALTKAAARVAAGLPGVEEGIACAGTAIESRTYEIKGRAFVFVRPGNVMLKLGSSLAAAVEMAKGAAPVGSLKAGAGGWVTITRGGGGVTAAMLTRWVKESHGLFVGGSGKVWKKAGKKVGKKVGKKSGGGSRGRSSAKKRATKRGG